MPVVKWINVSIFTRKYFFCEKRKPNVPAYFHKCLFASLIFLCYFNKSYVTLINLTYLKIPKLM